MHRGKYPTDRGWDSYPELCRSAQSGCGSCQQQGGMTVFLLVAEDVVQGWYETTKRQMKNILQDAVT